MMEQKAIVLCADNGYLDKLTTTIKSICAHDEQIKFYIFNDDIPTEWFQLMRQYLKVMQSEILNIKLTTDTLRQYRSPNHHINYAAYLRYFIADFVTESKALYLDCDIVVTTSLSPLFELDLGDYPLAAVADLPTTAEAFNSGVLLVNVAYWREAETAKHLLDLTNLHHETVYGDQAILNMHFANRWLALDLGYNLQVGADSNQFLIGDLAWYDLYKGVPPIIHYTTDKKPWLHDRFNRFRDIWWFYYGLSWTDVCMRTQVLKEGFSSLCQAPSHHALIFTNSGDIEHLDYLLAQLPQVQFHIAAPTYFSPNITRLQYYLNLAIYPCIDPASRKQLISEADIYLDINYGAEYGNILEQMAALQKPIFGFDQTSHVTDQNSYLSIYLSDKENPEQLLQAIKDYLKL